MTTVLVCLLLLLGGMITFHHIKLHYEQSAIRPNGKMVSVDSAELHVYAQGEQQEKPAIVFMSGATMPSPVYSYKKLYNKFTDEYRVIVPEKFGYGYSAIPDSPRDIETILEQTRTALRLAGERPPYILMPHSMTGIEAQLWAHKYPEEVRAIVGLDMALPEHYERMNPGARSGVYKVFSATVRHLGLMRLPMVQKAFGVYDKAFLTPVEWRQEQYLIARMTLNKLIVQESVTILDSALHVKQLGTLHTPMLLFVSDGSVQKNWREDYQAFLSRAPHGKLVFLDCSHMMHNEQAGEITEIAKIWLRQQNI